MADSTTHSCLPYPIRKARYSLALPFFTSAGVQTDPTSPDTEFSLDNSSASDCAEEITVTGGSNGWGYITLTGAETDGSLLQITSKSSNCLNSPALLYPANLAILTSGTLTAGAAGGGTLTATGYNIVGCFIRTTGGTGGGGTGGANNQARPISGYTNSTGAFTIPVNWETTVANDTTYDILLPVGVTVGMLKALNPTTDGRTFTVDAAGLGDANMVKAGPTGSGTAQTARDIGAAVPAAAPGAAGGLVICGSNAATTFATLTVTGAFSINGVSNVAQTGDAYLRLGAPVGASTSADIASTLSAIQNVQNNTFISDNFQGDIERPDSGSETIQIAFVFSDETGTAANLDSGNPIMVLTNNAGTDLSSRLGSWSNPATGKYVRTYTNSASDAIDGLLWEVTATIHSKLRRKPGRIQIVDTTAVDFTSSDRTNLNALVAGVTLSPSQGGVTFSSLSTGGGTLSLGVAVVQNLGILSLTVVDGNVALTTLNPTTMNVGTFAAGAGTLSTILTNVAAVKTDTAAVKVDTTATTSMFEAGIGAGVYRYTAASLVNAPSGGLTAQQVANALLLAPVGSAAAGSAMQELGTLYQLVDTGQFTAFALANAPAGGDVTVSLTVSPIKAVVDAGSVTGESFVIYQNSAGARSFVITDSNGAPVSLAGKHVRFTASDRRNMNEPVITLDNFSVMGLVVVTNTVTATFTAAMSATIRSLAYSIWNVTDNMPVAQGTMKILSISQEEP